MKIFKRRVHWYAVVLGARGNKLELYKYGDKKMTADEAVTKAKAELSGLGALFLLFGAKKVYNTGFGNEYDPVAIDSTFAALDKLMVKTGTKDAGKKVFN